jgi:hypothetical protein
MRSQRTKATMTTAVTTNVPTTTALVQPRSGPSMMPYSSPVMATNDSNAPRGSSGVASSSRERGL